MRTNRGPTLSHRGDKAAQPYSDSIEQGQGVQEMNHQLSTDEQDEYLQPQNGKTHSSFREGDKDTLPKDGLMKTLPRETRATQQDDILQTIAGIAGNVLEWYDFAVFGFFSDIIGDVFFPPQSGNAATVESFAVFGGAFLMRPVGGMMMGYIGDLYGRKKALVISIFLMAFPTFAMGCLPTYSRIGPLAIALLIIVRLLQGLSVGGQLVSSLVYTLENKPRSQWGLYGSFVLAAANFGTLLGGLAGVAVRSLLTEDQLISWGWRLPFLSGIVVSLSGFYLRSHGNEPHSTHQAVQTESREGEATDVSDNVSIHLQKQKNPIHLAFARHNRRSLAAACMVPLLWAAGFYLSFVWMAIYMDELITDPVPQPFLVNSASLLLSVCLFFPYAGILSDRYGRLRVMTIGGISLGLSSPICIRIIGKGNGIGAFFAQSLTGVALSCWGAPMMAWLVEGFDEEARLTSVGIGYNVAQALAGGLSPSLATVLADNCGVSSPGLILPCLAVIALCGLRIVAPSHSRADMDVLPIEEPEETEMVGQTTLS